MTKSETICDTCGDDLTTTTNCEDYRIVLKSEPIPSCGGTVTSMAKWPDFPSPLHFCNWECLHDWFLKREAINDTARTSLGNASG